MRGFIRVVAALQVFVGCSGVEAMEPGTNAVAIQQGMRLYNTHCIICHGVGGQGGQLGPSLLPRLTASDDVALAAYLQAGNPVKGMPAAPFEPAQLPALIQYLRSVTGTGGTTAGTRPNSGRAIPVAAVPELPVRPRDPAARDWIQLFNGRDLVDWTPKFAKHDLGENLLNTFRVEDGLLKVRYDQWSRFNAEFGHLYYKEPYSYYLLVSEYRFVDKQVAGGPPWANRNNGLMLHSQPPKTMLKDQDFPISIEVQLLGGLGTGPRTTANLCTPGTHVVYLGKLHTEHCTNSASPTFDGDQWVRVEVLVHGNELIRHTVNGQTVMEYSNPTIGGGNVNPVDPAVKIDGTAIAGGYITLQAETAPTDFRKVELLNLEGCTDPKAANYKSYFVKSNPAMCR